MIEGFEITCPNGAAAAGPAGGARAGARIFERGGNAMDAAAGAALACAVLEPQAVDTGGYVAAAVVLEARTGRVWSVDANAVAPEAAREDMFKTLPARRAPHGINEIEYGCSVADDANVYGPLSVAVPGFISGAGVLHERWGRLAWSRIIEPALELTENLRYGLVRPAIIAKQDAIRRFPITAEILLPHGRVPDEDERWRRPDLARTLERLASEGWRDFYEGQIGRAISDFVSAQGGILTRRDMAKFSPRVTVPVSGVYRGARIHTAIPPNGGFSVLAALREFERADVLPDSDPCYWDRWISVLKNTWRERLWNVSAGATRNGTIHVAAGDAEGNLVSMTISQGGLFGSCLAVPGTGIILGHGMCRFDPHPGLENSPGPGKRPLNNVCPLIIRMPDRDIAIGLRGGRRIVSVCAQLAQRLIDYGDSVRESSIAPRIHTLNGEPIEVSQNFDAGVRAVLGRMGYRIETPDEVAGAAHGVEILRSSREIRAGGNTWAAGV
jgi:gamma-glutamyltranspeptidase/glutathione hydrolase